MNARMEVNLHSRRREVFGSKKKTGGVPFFLALTTSKGLYQHSWFLQLHMQAWLPRQWEHLYW